MALIDLAIPAPTTPDTPPARHRRARRHRPAVGCSYVIEAWGPHPGCAEFMSQPDQIPCWQPATHVVKTTSPDGERWHERMCAFHATRTPDPDGYRTRAYRFRRPT